MLPQPTPLQDRDDPRAIARKVVTAFAGAGIRAAGRRHTVGLSSVVVRIQVHDDHMARALRAGAMIEAAANRPVSFRQTGAYLEITVPRTGREFVPFAPYARQLCRPFFGLDQNRQPVWAELDENLPHALVGSITGGGKSTLLQAWAISESMRSTLVLLDGRETASERARTWRPFRGTGHVVAEGPAACVRALLWVVEHVRTDPGRVMIFVDEVTALPRSSHKQLRELALRGRIHDAHLVTAFHYVREDVASRILTTNIDARIALRTNDPTGSVQILRWPGAESLGGFGEAMISLYNQRPTLFQAARPDDDAWPMIRRITPPRPADAEGWPLPDDDAGAAITQAQLDFAIAGGRVWGGRWQVSGPDPIKRRFSVGSTRASDIRDAAQALVDADSSLVPEHARERIEAHA